jgi:ATP-binding cassette subfamily F protein 3
VILVSHDMHLLSMVADRLWLVKDGAVEPYEDDLQAYRKMLLTPDTSGKGKGTNANGGKAKPAKPEAPKASREEIQALRSEVRKCEARVEKIHDMRDKLAKKLADPKLYEDGRVDEAAVWQRKYSEVMEAQDRAEAMWLSAQDKLEKALK